MLPLPAYIPPNVQTDFSYFVAFEQVQSWAIVVACIIFWVFFRVNKFHVNYLMHYLTFPVHAYNRGFHKSDISGIFGTKLTSGGFKKLSIISSYLQ